MADESIELVAWNPAWAQRFAEQKGAVEAVLAEKHRTDRDAYTGAKSDFVNGVLRRLESDQAPS